MQRAVRRLAVVTALSTLAAATVAGAGEIRVQCYSDGNECEVTQDLAKKFEAQNSDVKVTVDKVPYKAVLEQLPVQLAAGEGPDIARAMTDGYTSGGGMGLGLGGTKRLVDHFEIESEPGQGTRVAITKWKLR